MDTPAANRSQLGLLHGGAWDKLLLVSLPGVSCVRQDPQISLGFPWALWSLTIELNGLTSGIAPEKWNCYPFDKLGNRISTCPKDTNMGWRYVMYTSGALVFVMSVLRITVIRLRETPKYLLGEGEEELLVENFQAMATKYNRPCSLTVEMLQDCGTIKSAHGESKFSVSELTVHFRGLFATKTVGFSTCLIWLSWTLIVSFHGISG